VVVAVKTADSVDVAGRDPETADSMDSKICLLAGVAELASPL